MKTLALLSLAAGAALVPGGATAQTVSAPVAREVPDMPLRAPPGTTWQRTTPPPPPRMAPPAPRMAPAPTVRVAPAPRPPMYRGPATPAPRAMPAPHRPALPVVTRHGKDRVVIHRGKPGHHGGTRVRTRIERGHRIPQFWFHPRYRVDNWQHYGFTPPQDGSWIRYYDDALLIDRYGNVRDGRWDMDWDGYDDRWERDEDGRAYRGDDYGYDEDYGEWSEEMGDGDYPPPPPPPPGYYGYGYGYASPGMITITETTVTTPGGPAKVKVHKKKVRKAPPRKAHKPKCDCPTPYPGERG